LQRATAMLRAVYAFAAVALAIGLPAAGGAAAQANKPPVNANAAVIQDFLKRVDQYVALHKKLEDPLPKLPKQTTPEQMDAHQRALGKLIQEARKGARQGDIFTSRMRRFVRTLLGPIFSGASGLQIKAEILDKEYKGNAKLVVNGRYPDEVPVSTMPPQVLAALPKLPEELEYRFIQNNLILFDPHAHIIADYMVRVFD
jgi:hypothetical protein